MKTDASWNPKKLLNRSKSKHCNDSWPTRSRRFQWEKLYRDSFSASCGILNRHLHFKTTYLLIPRKYSIFITLVQQSLGSNPSSIHNTFVIAGIFTCQQIGSIRLSLLSYLRWDASTISTPVFASERSIRVNLLCFKFLSEFNWKTL